MKKEKTTKWQFLYYTDDQEDFSDPKEKIFEGAFEECCVKFKEFMDSYFTRDACDEEAHNENTGIYEQLPREMFRDYI